MLENRRGEPRDLPSVAAIQRESPEAAQWPPADYLALDFWVADEGGQIAGFLVGRAVAGDERELLNLAVALTNRRQGVARGLMESFLRASQGVVFLEVRESNQSAQRLYKSLGFKEVNLRRNYYYESPEAAIVMKFHSC